MRVRESRRRRSIRIGVGPSRPLEAIVPTGTSDRSLRKVLERNREWIDRPAALGPGRRRPAVPPGPRPPVSSHLNGTLVPVVRRRGGRASARLTTRRARRRLRRHDAGGDRTLVPARGRHRIADRVDAQAAATAAPDGRSPSATRGRAGARARPRARSRSRGGCCSHPPRCSTTSSSTSSAICSKPNHSRAFWDRGRSPLPDRKVPHRVAARVRLRASSIRPGRARALKLGNIASCQRASNGCQQRCRLLVPDP